jgi:hypothetical protein
MEEQQQNIVKPRGGARKGAGRKAKGKNGTIMVTFRCSQDVYDILCQVENKTAYIEKAVRNQWRRDQY